MRIIRLDVKETESGWHLKDARFDDINLLVGVSGVGKTKIVEALRTLAGIATKPRPKLIPMKWLIEFNHESRLYCWDGEISRSGNNASVIFEQEVLSFLHERLTVDGTLLIEREKDSLTFRERESPKLNNSESALALLNGEAEIKSARSAFAFVAFDAGNRVDVDGFRFTKKKQKEHLSDELKPAISSLQQMAESKALQVSNYIHFWLTSLISLVSEKRTETLVAYVMMRIEPRWFAHIRDVFCEAFPSVSEVTVDFADKLREGGNPLALQFAIKEHCYGEWILQPEMSSGMLRTLLHLITVNAALLGSVLVVDEFENGLGKNCLPLMTDTLLEHDSQFSRTHHHPKRLSRNVVSRKRTRRECSSESRSSEALKGRLRRNKPGSRRSAEGSTIQSTRPIS